MPTLLTNLQYFKQRTLLSQPTTQRVNS